MTQAQTQPIATPEAKAPGREWLETMLGSAGKPGVLDQSREFASNQQGKEEALAEMSRKLEEWKPAIAAGQEYTLELEARGLGGHVRKLLGMSPQTMSSIDADSDAMKEVDTWEDVPGARSLEPEELQELMQSQQMIVKLQQDLLGHKDADGNPLFSTKEITEELWNTLVREGVMPENAVPDEYSKLKNTFDGAVELYEKRLADFTAEQGTKDELLAKIGTAKAFSEKGVDVAKKGLAFASAVGDVPGGETAALVMDLAEVTLAGGFVIAESAVQRDAEGVIDGVTAIVCGAVGQFVPGARGEMIVKGINVGVNGGKIAKRLSEGKPEEALAMLGDFLEGAFSMADTDSTNGTCAEIGSALSKAINAACDAKAIIDVITDPKGFDPAKLMAILAKVANDAVSSVQDRLPENHDAAGRLGAASDNLGEVQAGLEAISGMSNVDDSEEMKELREKLAQFESDAATARLEDGRLEFQEMLTNGFAPPDDEAELDAIRAEQSIDALILQMQKDKMILDLLDSAINAGLNIAKNIVPAIGVAMHGKEFAMRVVAAAQRAAELNEWLDNLEDATSAVSVYGEAIRNRVRNSKVQLSQETIQAALALAKTVGAVSSCTGLDMGAGQAIEKGAIAAQAATELAYDIYEEADLRIQWKAYKKALAEPQNRKAARKTMRGNPTLAKYTLAYGALKDEDPIAMEAMRKCGLTDKVLKNPKANCNKVVQFLELKFADDPVLVRCVPDKKAWHPGKPQLTLASWVLFTGSARTHEKAEPKLESSGDSTIQGALGVLVDEENRVRDMGGDVKDQIASLVQDAVGSATGAAPRRDQATIDALDELLEALAQVESALKAYKPTGSDGLPHDGMLAVADSFSALVVVRKRDVSTLRRDLDRIAAA